jgi:hypothetical protein
MGTTRMPRWVRTGAIALAGSIVVLFPAEVLGLSLGQQAVASASVNTSSVLGVYAGAGDVSAVGALAQSTGHQPSSAMDFLDGTSWQTIDNPSWLLSKWQGTGYQMIWGVPILPSTFTADSNSADTSGGAYGLAQGAAGAYNQYFATLARSLVAGGQGSSVIRLGWEFNGGWFPWSAGGHAASFIGYWQQIVTTMRSVPGANFRFEWNPTLGDLNVGDLASYYPGSAYVDYIGADVYDEAWATYPGAAAEFSTIENETYGLNWLASFAAQEGKAITFPEWGLGWGASANGAPVSAPGQNVSGGDNPTFINDMADWIAFHNVYEATFWDYGSSAVSSTTNPNTLGALAKDFGSSATPPASPLAPKTPTPAPAAKPTTPTAATPQPPTTTSTTPASTAIAPATATPAKPFWGVWKFDLQKTLTTLKRTLHHQRNALLP